MAGYKTISIMFLIVVVALAGVSPVLAQDEEFILTLTPAAACPGETVTVTVPTIATVDDIVGGGISVAAVSPLSDGAKITYVLSSDPVGLVANQVCSIPVVGTLVPGAPLRNVQCTFVVSESATCGSHYTVTLALSADEALIDRSSPIGSAPFDIDGPCCAVGGCAQPVNTFVLLSPWLTAIGLIGCIGTVVVVAKKRHP